MNEIRILVHNSRFKWVGFDLKFRDGCCTQNLRRHVLCVTTMGPHSDDLQLWFLSASGDRRAFRLEPYLYGSVSFVD